MRKQLSLAHKVIVPGRRIDLQHTDVAATFARARAEQARNQKEVEQVVTPIKQRRRA
jgi:hypothetical protein